MNENLSAILDDCLSQVAAGETAESCLGRYPEEAAELEPLLAAALEVRALNLAGERTPAGEWQRVQARLETGRPAGWEIGNDPTAGLEEAGWESEKIAGVKLGRPAGENDTRQSGRAFLFLRALGKAARVALAVLVIGLVMAVAGVAASGPESVAYGLRLTVERVPSWLAVGPLDQGMAELSFSDRRLAEVRSHLIATGRVAPAALAALLDSDADVADLARGVPDAQQEQIAGWIAGHANCLDQLGRSARGERASITLRTAAEQIRGIAASLKSGVAPQGGCTGE